MNIMGSMLLAGVIGWPIAHSKSPAMHNAAAKDLGLNLIYVPLAVHPDDLKAAVRGLRAFNFRGANVTVPHKEAVMDFLDEIDPAAQAIGAVNTIVVGVPGLETGDHWPVSKTQLPTSGSRLSGYNTDWSGFLADLKMRGLELRNQMCLVIGAGGSARAVAYGLASTGNQVHIFARRPEQARMVAEELGRHCPAGELKDHPWKALVEKSEQFSDAKLIVNCTPVGMSPNAGISPWPAGLALPEEAFVYDLVYQPAETRLMQEASKAGRQTANGLGMLVQQGVLAFQLWTGLDPNPDIMSAALG